MSSAPRHVLAHRLRHTLGTLLFASLSCVLLWLVRAGVAHNLRLSGFMFNLLLAWIPVLLALWLRSREDRAKPWQLWVLGAAWLLFFPNAFYLVTDLIHIKKFGTDGVPKWFDLLLTVAFACGGMFLGCLSLYLLHLSVRARRGWKAGWAFAVAMLALGSLGIYLGRFSRLNSWDIVARPLKLVSEVSDLAAPPEGRLPLAFVSAFFLFSLTVYTFVVSMARLHEVAEEPAH